MTYGCHACPIVMSKSMNLDKISYFCGIAYTVDALRGCKPYLCGVTGHCFVLLQHNIMCTNSYSKIVTFRIIIYDIRMLPVLAYIHKYNI